MSGTVIKGPDGPNGNSHLLHPMTKGMEILSLMMDCQNLKAEEHLVNIESKRHLSKQAR